MIVYLEHGFGKHRSSCFLTNPQQYTKHTIFKQSRNGGKKTKRRYQIIVINFSEILVS